MNNYELYEDLKEMDTPKKVNKRLHIFREITNDIEENVDVENFNECY